LMQGTTPCVLCPHVHHLPHGEENFSGELPCPTTPLFSPLKPSQAKQVKVGVSLMQAGWDWSLLFLPHRVAPMQAMEFSL
jgi:CHASE1-domain containing sensor protein